VLRRQLDQQATELVSKSAGLGEKRIEQSARANETEFMADRPRQLYREAEVRRDGGGPLLIGARPVRAVERRVDLGRRELTRVALEM
jgi:hypothetical protein